MAVQAVWPGGLCGGLWRRLGLRRGGCGVLSTEGGGGFSKGQPPLRQPYPGTISRGVPGRRDPPPPALREAERGEGGGAENGTAGAGGAEQSGARRLTAEGGPRRGPEEAAASGP